MIAFVTGLGSWTLIEYLVHRFVGHERVLGKAAAAEHLEHHAKVDWFVPWSRKILLAVVVLGGLTLLTAPVLGLSFGLSLAGGIVTAWLAYEALHRAIHVWPPRTAYTRWAWRHHLHHHFADPSSNHGVSSPLWDLVFRTYTPVETVRIPRRQAGKLPWLLVEGRVAPGLEETYSVSEAPSRSAPGAG